MPIVMYKSLVEIRGNAGIMTINSDRIRLDNKASLNANTPDVDPTQGLIKLPEERIDTSNQIGQICPRGRYAKKPLARISHKL
jgi:large exoprotein involved in heme utilization and adhesion